MSRRLTYRRRDVYAAATAVLAALLLSAPAAHAVGLDIEAILDPSGDPALVADLVPDLGRAAATWEICDPGCRPAAPAETLTPGPTTPGTVFHASADYRGNRL